MGSRRSRGGNGNRGRSRGGGGGWGRGRGRAGGKVTGEGTDDGVCYLITVDEGEEERPEELQALGGEAPLQDVAEAVLLRPREAGA